MMGFDTLLIGGFVTYLVIKYAENTWKAEPMDMDEIEGAIEQHIEGRAMIREKNREVNKVRRDLKVAYKLKELDDEVKQGKNKLRAMGFHSEEEDEEEEFVTSKPRKRPTPLRASNVEEEEEEEEGGASIHIYSKPTPPSPHMRKRVVK